jgi:vancomycin resistance protein YoaR
MRARDARGGTTHMAVFARSGDRAGSSRRVAWKLAIAPLIVLVLALAVGAAASVVFAQRALPGIAVAGVAVGSLEESAVRTRLQNELVLPWAASTVVVSDGARTWRSTNGALGIAPDVDRAVAAALSYGKTGTLVDRLYAWFDALRGEANIAFTMRAQGDGVDRWVSSVAHDVDVAPVSGELRVTTKGLEATKPQLGRAVDRTATIAELLSAESLGDREVVLRVRSAYPEVDASGFDDAFARASAVVTPTKISVEDRSWTENPDGLATLLMIDRVPAKIGELSAIPADAIAPAARYRYNVSLANERIATWTTALGAYLDHPGKSARFQVSREGAISIVPSESGVRIEQDKLRAMFLDQLVVPAAGAVREIAAPATVDKSIFTTDAAKALAPNISRTSTFTTSYPPSASRHANISTGASQFDGVVIMPGQTFSFWELLGPVTVERGYAFAGAIINNRSDENVIGGGLCQVSTTIFNAISRQGYDIVERHAHGYYIDRYPVGYDAAVFDPGVDFKWRNDTQNPVFIWSWSGDTTLTIDVWGIPTGRTVVISDAYQTNFVKPAPDQPADPAYPAGVTVEGRDAFRTRTVYENGQVIHQDNFASHYAPVWGGPAKVVEAAPKP